jgi:histone acetyltransferase (RNA polymerase elongator complex component)
MIVLGGSWDAYTEEYKTEFIKGLYDACTTFSQLKIQPSARGIGEDGAGESKKYGFQILNEEQIQFSATLAEAIERNQLAKNRVI